MVRILAHLPGFSVGGEGLGPFEAGLVDGSKFVEVALRLFAAALDLIGFEAEGSVEIPVRERFGDFSIFRSCLSGFGGAGGELLPQCFDLFRLASDHGISFLHGRHGDGARLNSRVEAAAKHLHEGIKLLALRCLRFADSVDLLALRCLRFADSVDLFFKSPEA